uniref:Uncharacterized protein n=1 Tax=Steinernema glaseri TaxID=37863 RepID=A0A1I7YXK5_9BILA
MEKGFVFDITNRILIKKQIGSFQRSKIAQCAVIHASSTQLTRGLTFLLLTSTEVKGSINNRLHIVTPPLLVHRASGSCHA